MGASVYIETSYVSYLASDPSRDLLIAAHQQTSHDWWRTRRPGFELFVSQLVLDEAAAGNAEMARRRAAYLSGLPILDVTPVAVALAKALVGMAALPERASVDALHIAIAASHGLEFLLTWNCRHIANAELRPGVERECRRAGFRPPVLCTPEELMGRHRDD